MGKKKIQPPQIVQLKADKVQAKKDLENELIRLDDEIKDYWATITNEYVKVGMKFDLPTYRKGHILITNMTEKLVMYKIVSTLSNQNTYYVKKFGRAGFGKFVYNASPTFRRKVTIDKILEL